jgi:hypothetical protein
MVPSGTDPIERHACPDTVGAGNVRIASPDESVPAHFTLANAVDSGVALVHIAEQRGPVGLHCLLLSNVGVRVLDGVSLRPRKLNGRSLAKFVTHSPFRYHQVQHQGRRTIVAPARCLTWALYFSR